MLIRRLFIVLVGLALLIGPVVVRNLFLGYNERPYTPPAMDELSNAATPIPTRTPAELVHNLPVSDPELRPGPVVVDLAHFNRLARTQFQPLADALARHDIGLRFWFPTVDPFQVESFLDFPDQSAKLAPLLKNASALVVVSPFFLWSEQEIALAERFVADGGRLLLISDPDVLGDVAQDINNLGDPFGVVFNDDYLYNTVENDENHTYIFLDEFLDSAIDLTGSRIAQYGARSISGEISAQALTGENTLSGLRTGLSGFTTIALAGKDLNGTRDRVLAMSDFDVLTEPFVARQDNGRMVDFVATFLAGGARGNTVTDFPNYLGKNVALVLGSSGAIDAQLLDQTAQLQQKLEESGRTLTLVRSALGTEPIGDERTSTGVLTPTLMARSTRPIPPTLTATPTATADLFAGIPTDADLIYVAAYDTAMRETNLLSIAGFEVITVTVTPSPTPSPTPTMPTTPTPMPTPPARVTAMATMTATMTAAMTATASITATEPLTGTESPADTLPEEQSSALNSLPSTAVTITQEVTSAITSTLSVTATAPISGMNAPTATATITATLTPTPTPEVITYLRSTMGLRLLAEETLLILQTEQDKNGRLVAILGMDAAGLQAGVERLLADDFSSCVRSDQQIICPFTPTQDTPESRPSTTPTGSSPEGRGTPTPSGRERPQPDGTPTTPPPDGTLTPTTEPEITPVPPGEGILLIDDDDQVESGEISEADTWLQVLTAAGHSPDLWSIEGSGLPTTEKLQEYAWVIWSAGNYTGGGPEIIDLEPLVEFLNNGGRATISSQNPFFGESTDEPSTIADVVTTSEIPALVVGLPDEPIVLDNGLPPVRPLEDNFGGTNVPKIVLRRGQDSGGADKPLLVQFTNSETPSAANARLLVLGMSVSWFPPEVSEQLIQNMAEWMLNP